MVAALVEATGHGYGELMETPYEDVLQMNVDALAVSKARKEAMENERIH
jgi:hypothetical protein